MIKKHWEGVINAATTPITNAKAEAINSGIPWFKRMACGYRSRENFRYAIYFHLEGLHLQREALKQPTRNPEASERQDSSLSRASRALSL